MRKFKSIRHVKRYRQIIATFSKYGLKDLIAYVEVVRLPRKVARPHLMKETAQNLRLALQELGPTFIKAGQLLSSRSDFIPPEIINELQKLLDQVDPVDFNLIRNQIETELGKNINELFSHFEKEPVASASLAQVHKAKLENNQTIALKIQRPGIKKIIDVDIDILYDFAAALQDRLLYVKAYNLAEIVTEFKKNIYKELNFELEGLNMQKIASNLEEFKYIKIPKIYWQYSSKKILGLEFIKGYKVTERDKLKSFGLNTSDLASRLIDVYSKQIHVDGFFQADPHIGNIFIKHNGIIQIIDFGSVGALDENLRKEIASLIFNFIFNEGDQAAENLLRIGKQKPHTDFGALRNEISKLVADHANLPPKYLSLGQGLIDLSQAASKFHIELPSAFSLISRTLLLLDDLIRNLDPDFDYTSYLSHLTPLLVYERLQANFTPKKIARNLVEMSNLTSSLPSKLNYLIDKIIKDEFHVVFQHEGLEKVTRSINIAGLSISLSLVSVGITFLAILSLLIGLPTLAITLGIFVLILLLYLLYKMMRSIEWP